MSNLRSRLLHPLRHWWWLALLLLLLLYWQLPIQGTVIVSPVALDVNPQWPQIMLDPLTPQPGDEVTVTVVDNTPWTHVQLTVDGVPAIFDTAQTLPGGVSWQWSWHLIMPSAAVTTLRQPTPRPQRSW